MESSRYHPQWSEKIVKKLKFLCLIWVFSLTTAVKASDRIRINADSEQRNICDLYVARIRGLVVEANAISEDSLRSRVDNERYNACPYYVAMEYQGVKLSIDFSNAFTTKDIVDYDGANDISTGFFVYDEKGWHAEPDGLANGSEDVAVKKRGDGATITGTFVRRGINSARAEHCIGIAAVGANGFATTGICSLDKTTLDPLAALLRGTSVLWFEK